MVRPLFSGHHSQIIDASAAWQHGTALTHLPALARVRCPVMGLFGALDTSTPAQTSVDNMRRTLTAAGNSRVTLKIFPHADHPLALVQDASDTSFAKSPGMAPRVIPSLRAFLASWKSTPY